MDASRALGLRLNGVHRALRDPYRRHHGYLFWYSDHGHTFEAYQKRVRNTAKARGDSFKAAIQVGVQQLEPTTGRVIAEFPSVTEAAGDKFNPSWICAACKGKAALAHGFRWQYADPALRHTPKVHRPRTRGVHRVDAATGEVLATYQPIASAKAEGYDPGEITKVARGKLKHHKGFHWVYTDAENNTPTRSHVRQGKPVHQIDRQTGEIIATFEKMSDATEHGFTIPGICNAIRGGISHHKGFKWEYAPTSA